MTQEQLIAKVQERFYNYNFPIINDIPVYKYLIESILEVYEDSNPSSFECAYYLTNDYFTYVNYLESLTCDKSIRNRNKIDKIYYNIFKWSNIVKYNIFLEQTLSLENKEDVYNIIRSLLQTLDNLKFDEVITKYYKELIAMKR